jgi:hypothetical protein
MALSRVLARRIQMPAWLALLLALIGGLITLWAIAVANDRNPLPFPDRNYHVHSASSTQALVALEDLMRQHGDPPRFRADGPGVQRTIFASGNIINQPGESMLALLGKPGAALGLVVAEPDDSARAVAARFRELGFKAESIHDAEPGLPIAFVRTDALLGSIIVFRKPILRMGTAPDRWTPRTAEGPTTTHTGAGSPATP